MWDDRTFEAFEKARNQGQGSLSGGDFISTDKDIPTLSGLSDVLGPSFSGLRYLFRFESAGYLADHRTSLLERMREIVGVPESSWKEVRPTLGYVWGRFFGAAPVERDFPGFVILMPGGYVTTRHQFGLKAERVISRQPTSVEAVDDHRFDLKFGEWQGRYSLPLDLSRVPLRKPPDRDEKWSQPVARRMVRKFAAADGGRLPTDFILQVGRADPDDARALRRGEYYPNTEGKRVQGERGVCFTRDISVIVIARLVPSPSAYEALVHQVSITLSETGEEILDFNSLSRSFGRFAQHYPGISQLLEERLR